MIITFTGRKGGITKTTSSGHVAYALTCPGEATGPGVLLVDTDSQHQCSSILGLAAGPGLFNYFMAAPGGYADLGDCVQVTAGPGLARRKRLLLMASSQQTIALVGALKAQLDAKQIGIGDIAQRFHQLGEEVEYVVIDTPASGLLQEAAVLAADVVVVPTGLEYLDMEAVPATLAMVEALHSGCRVGILPTLMDNRVGDHKRNLAALRTKYGAMVFEPIHRRAAVAGALAEGRLIFETDPGCEVALEYSQLAAALVALGGGTCG